MSSLETYLRVHSYKNQSDFLFIDENYWLSASKISEMVGVDINSVNQKLSELSESNEVQRRAIIKEGIELELYSLDGFIALVHCLNSPELVLIRKWSREILREYIVKGYSFNSPLMSKLNNDEYFTDLLEILEELRLSKRKFYEKVTNLYSLSINYDKEATITKLFYKSVIEHCRWAIDGSIITENILLQIDAVVLKYLDFAEAKAHNCHPMLMEDWARLFQDFLKCVQNPSDITKGTTLRNLELAIEAEKAKQPSVFRTIRKVCGWICDNWKFIIFASTIGIFLGFYLFHF